MKGLKEEKRLATPRKLLASLLILAAFLCPFSTIHLSGIYFTLSDFVFLLAGPAAIGLWRNNRERCNRTSTERLIQNRWLLGSGFILVGYLASELFASGGSSTLAGVALQYVFVFAYLPFLFLQIEWQDRARAARAFAAGLTSVIFLGSVLSQFFPALYRSLLERGFVVGLLRMGSFMGINDLSKSIAVCIPLVFLLYNIGYLTRFQLGVFGFVALIGLVLTASWGGTIASAVAVVLLLLFVFVRQPRRALLGILSIALIIATIFVLNAIGPESLHKSFDKRMVSVLQTGEFSKAGNFLIKKNLMKEALSIIEKHPVFGIGAGKYPSLSLYQCQVHNAFLLLWAEAGVFGLIGLLLVLLASWKVALMSTFSSGRSAIAVPVLVLVFIFCLNAGTNTYLYARFQILPLLLAVYLLDASTSQGPEAQTAA